MKEFDYKERLLEMGFIKAHGHFNQLIDAKRLRHIKIQESFSASKVIVYIDNVEYTSLKKDDKARWEHLYEKFKRPTFTGDLSTLQKVDKLKEQLKLNEWYLVPCVVNIVNENKHFFPIINHLHHDKENGQTHLHYHLDYRFDFENIHHNFARKNIQMQNSFNDVEVPYADDQIFKKGNDIVAYNMGPRIDVLKKNSLIIEYLPGHFLSTQQLYITPVKLIKQSKIKSCLKKHKCPHKGYDLSKEIPNIDGVITCPLHNLKFKNNEIINLNEEF